jgi:hypothetical protein
MNDDRRRAFRVPLPEGQEHGLLRVSRGDVPVRIVNTSAVGFAIVSPERLDAEPGKLLPLQTLSGWSEVRVVRTAPHEDGTVLGVERVRELAQGPPVSTRWPSLAVAGVGAAALGLSSVLFTHYWSLEPDQRQPPQPSEVLGILGQKAQQAWERLRG